jgi:hypothetical protein
MGEGLLRGSGRCNVELNQTTNRRPRNQMPEVVICKLTAASGGIVLLLTMFGLDMTTMGSTADWPDGTQTAFCENRIEHVFLGGAAAAIPWRCCGSR